MEIEFNTVDADEAVQLLDADGWWRDDGSGDGGDGGTRGTETGTPGR